MRSNSDWRAGFTLLEALVALALLTGVTALVMMLVSTSRWHQSIAEQDALLVLNARSLLSRIGHQIPLIAGSQSGNMEDGHTWTVHIEPYPLHGGGDQRTRREIFEIKIHLYHPRSNFGGFEVTTLLRAQ